MDDFMARWLKWSLVALVGCGFVAMLVYALVMRDDIRSASLEPPLVEASDVALKRRPDEPGGLEIPHQDKVVFNLLDRPSDTSVAPLDDEQVADAGVTVPPESEPVDVTTTLVEAIESQTVEVSETPDAVAGVEEIAVVAPAAPVQAKPVEVATVAAKEEPTPAPKVIAKTEPENVVKPVAKSGGYGVQLASVSGKADATKAMDKFDANAKLAGLTGRIQNVEVKGKTYYRVQFMGLASRAEAESLCKKLAVTCLPVAPK